MNVTCCTLKTLPKRLCNNNMTDVAHEVMLHDILPLARCKVYDKSVDTWAIGKHKLFYPWADVALRLCPLDNIKPLYNMLNLCLPVTHVSTITIHNTM